MVTGGSAVCTSATERPSRYWKRRWCQRGHAQNLWCGVSDSMPQKGQSDPPSTHLDAKLWVTSDPVITARSDALVLSAAGAPLSHLHDAQ